MDLNEHERWNEAMAQKYNPDAFITRSGVIIRWVERRRLLRTLRALDIRGSDTVLDLGCGPGNLLPLMRANRVVGIDPSEFLLAQARERVANLPHIQLIKGFAEKLPFGNAVFDRILCSEVLEHVRSPDVVLQEARRVAKPGARIVITVPNEELINFTKRWVIRLGLKKWIAGHYAMSNNMLEEWHVNEITVEKIKTLTETSFLLTRIIGVPFFPVSYHRIFVFNVR